MAVTQSELIGLYLSYFGRPPDPDGLAFYTSNASFTIQSVSVGFSESPESQRLYGTFSLAQINAIYQNLFNRDAEPDGLNYWFTEVNSGRINPAQAAMAIYLGAQNEDAITVANKVQVATAFVAQLNTSAELAGYSGDTAAARVRAFVHTIDASATNLATALADIGTQVAFTTGQTGQTFAVTKDSTNVVTFTHAGSLLTVSETSGVWTFTTMGGNAGSAAVAGTIAGFNVPQGSTLQMTSAQAGSKAFTGFGATLVVANPAGEDLTVTLTASGVDQIQLTAGHDYTMSVAQAHTAKVGASGVVGHFTSTGKITIADNYTNLGGGVAADLKISGADTTLAVVTVSSDISGTSFTGVDGLRLNADGKIAMTAAQALLIESAPGADQVVTLTTAATKLGLDAEVETFKLANTTNSVTQGAIGQIVIGGSGDDSVTAFTGTKVTMDLNSGANTIVVAAGADVSLATFKATGGTVGYDVDGATTGKMTVAQVAAITSAAGTQNITLATIATALTLDKSIETFTLGDFINSVTVGVKSQGVTGGSKADTVTVLDAMTSTIDLRGGANVVIVGDAMNLSGATFAATGGTIGLNLDAAATATLSGAEAGQVTAATGTQTITVATAASDVKLSSVLENFKLGNFTNSVTLGAAAQNVTGGTGADTVSVGALAATGTLDGAAGTADKLSVGGTMGAATVTGFEILNVTADASVVAVNAGAAVNTTTLAMAADVGLTMTVVQNESMKASATVANGGQSITLSNTGTTTAIAGVETYVLAAGSTHLTLTTAGQTVEASALADGDVVTLLGSVAGTVTLTDGDLAAGSYTGALKVNADAGSNVITTGGGADVINGAAGDDTINAGAGNDTVSGGDGNDAITLGLGSDVVIVSFLGSVDTIADFSAVNDKIQLSKTALPALLATGSLGATTLEIGAGFTDAHTAGGRIVYNSTTGDLFYDSDGSGAAVSVLIVTLTGAPVLTAANFSVIA